MQRCPKACKNGGNPAQCRIDRHLLGRIGQPSRGGGGMINIA